MSSSMNRTLSRAALPAVTLVVVLHGVALAQGTGRSMDIDLSIRSAGMGGASTAVFWGEDSDHWGNPATLGFVRGVRYEWGRTRLVPGLANDVHLTSNVWKAGGGGVGIYSSGTPFGSGLRLDYGGSGGTDASGNPTGTFSSYEQVDAWGWGINTIEAIGTLMRAMGTEPPEWMSRVEVSGGESFKDIEMSLAPGLYGVGRTKARDGGVILKVTPLDRWDATSGLPLRIEVAGGYSKLNYNDDAVVTFINEDQASRASRHRRLGVALRAIADPPGLRRLMAEPTAGGALARGLSPFFSVGVAHDHAKIDAGEGTFGYRTYSWGAELAVANAFGMRVGHYRDRTGHIDGGTFGWFLGVPVGPWGAVRYEQAKFPQAQDSGLPDLTRHAATAWVNPIAIWRSLSAR